MGNLLPQNVGSIINYWQQSTEVAQWGTPSCSRPQPATDIRVRDGTPTQLTGRTHTLIMPSWAVSPEPLLHSINLCSLSSTGNQPCNFSIRGNHLAYAATQGIRSHLDLRVSGHLAYAATGVTCTTADAGVIWSVHSTADAGVPCSTADAGMIWSALSAADAGVTCSASDAGVVWSTLSTADAGVTCSTANAVVIWSALSTADASVTCSTAEAGMICSALSTADADVTCSTAEAGMICSALC